MAEKPTIGFIMGDPAGIGPEITLRILSMPELHELCLPVVIGDCALLERLNQDLGLSLPLGAAPSTEGAIRVVDTGPGATTPPIAPGSISAAAGQSALRAIRGAFELAAAGEVAALVMAPLTKESLALADARYHSEFDLFSDLTGVPDVRAAVKWESIVRMSVTGHMPFREIADRLTPNGIATTGRQLLSVMRALGHVRPRLAVAALNPHAGEGGLFGHEEQTIIQPAIEALRGEGHDVYGPIPADTVFARTIKGDFHGVVFLYHDQGNIAMKSVAFGEGVLIYSSLPFPVTSVGHGSALDIAGRGIADPGNLFEALRVAVQLAHIAGAD